MSRLEVVWSTRTFWLMVLLGLASTSQAALFSSTLPASRSVQVGETASFVGTIINASSVTAVDCRVALLSPIDASLSYQPATAQHAPLGNANTLQRDDLNGTIIYPKNVRQALRNYLGLGGTANDERFTFNNTEN